MTRTFLASLINAILSLRGSATDEQAYYASAVYPEWKEDGEYETGNRVRFEGLLYKCLQGHAAQAQWKPDVSTSLWVRIDDPAEEWPEWRQPVGSVDAYMTGAKVSHNNKHWICTMDYCTYEPGVFGWEEVTS